MNKLAFAGLIVVLAGAGATAFAENESDWPREISRPGATIVIYQPQVDSFLGDELSSRAAVSVKIEAQEEPVFGAVWMTSRVTTDRDTRMVEILDTRVDRVRFPDAKPEREQQLADLLEAEMPTWDLSLSLDRLLAGLDLAEREQLAADRLETSPPKIIVVDHPSVLVTIDGEPELRQVDDSTLMQVVNTPFLIVLEPKSNRYYLDGGEIWYIAEGAKGPWQETEKVPKEVEALSPPAEAEEETAGEDTPRDPRTPEIVVETGAAELIVIDGEPTYSPLAGNDLLYMTNTESDIILEVETQTYFLAISGRWYAAKSMKGPWSYVASDELPASFAEIPEDSDMGHVLAFVAGTTQAEEAVLDAQIPQTSAIDRKTTKLEVTYDGDPKFEAIEGTEMLYAVNTAYSVIKVGAMYYACHQAVWFESGNPIGPWAVADEIPHEIYGIPPDSPVYNVKYVHVYDSTPEVVYVGYTPGYTGSYVYNTTIVYGTGFWYPGWYGRYYYPRPRTWGFSVRWSPWYGWGFGLSYSTGPFTFHFGVGRHHHGWWGPVGYRGYRHGYHHGYRAGYRAGQRQAHHNNIYNRPDNRPRNAAPATREAGNRPGHAPGQQNNVYADRDGNVYRRTDDGWQKRDGNEWSKTDRAGDAGRPSTGDAARPSTPSRNDGARPSQPSTKQSQPSTRQTQPSTGAGNLNRDYNARQRGSSRTNNYRSSGGGGSRGGRGGGGRRR